MDRFLFVSGPAAAAAAAVDDDDDDDAAHLFRLLQRDNFEDVTINFLNYLVCAILRGNDPLIAFDFLTKSCMCLWVCVCVWACVE